MHWQSPILRWRKFPERYRLEGNRCNRCGIVYFPKKELCECSCKEFSSFQLSGKGKILTYTEIKSSPEEFSEMTPYCVGIIELAEGPKITGQITDATVDELKVGDDVEQVFRKFLAVGDSGVIHYGVKFKKIE